MYFGESVIKFNNSFDIYYENIFEKVYNYNLNSMLNDLSLLENLSLVKEDAAALAISGPVQKSSFKEKITKMIKAVIDWIKNAFTACIKAINKLAEKIRYNTFKDSIVQKLFGNIKYSDLESAKDKGWKGVLANKYSFINPDINAEEVLRSTKEIIKENNIFEKLEEMKLDLREEAIKQKEEEIDEIIKELNTKINRMNPATELYNQSLNNLFVSMDLRFAQDAYNRKASRGFKSEEEYYQAQQEFQDAAKKHILPFVFNMKGDKDGYYFPDSSKFNILKDFVLNSKKFTNNINQSYNPIIKDIQKSLADNTSEVLKLTMSKDNSDNNFKENEIRILKTAIKVDDVHLKIYKTVTKNFLQVCNYMFIEGVKTYSKIIIDVKKYIKVETA